MSKPVKLDDDMENMLSAWGRVAFALGLVLAMALPAILN